MEERTYLEVMKKTYFEVVVGDQVHGYECIDFNKRCNYIKEFMTDFVAFFNNDKDGDTLLRAIHKDKIVQIKNIGTE